MRLTARHLALPFAWVVTVGSLTAFAAAYRFEGRDLDGEALFRFGVVMGAVLGVVMLTIEVAIRILSIPGESFPHNARRPPRHPAWLWYACAALMAIASVLSSLAGTENRYPELPHIDHSRIHHVMNGLSIFTDLGGVLVLHLFVPTYLYAWVRYRRRNFWRHPTPNPQHPTTNPTPPPASSNPNPDPCATDPRSA